MFRVACRTMSLKAIGLDAGIPYSTLRSYAGHNGETAEMPASAVYKLCGVVPNELLSLLLPEGKQVVSIPDGIDHDAISDLCQDYLRAKEAAHHPSSPAGREIAACEDGALSAKAACLKAVAA